MVMAKVFTEGLHIYRSLERVDFVSESTVWQESGARYIRPIIQLGHCTHSRISQVTEQGSAGVCSYLARAA